MFDCWKYGFDNNHNIKHDDKKSSASTAKAEQMIRQKSHSLCFYSSPVFFPLLLLSVVARLHHTNDVKTSFSIRLKLNVFQSHCWPTVRFTIKLWAPNTSFKVIPILSVLIFLTLFFGSYFRHLSINASIFFVFHSSYSFYLK